MQLEDEVGDALKTEKTASGLGADMQPVPEPTVRDLSVPQAKGPRVRKTTYPDPPKQPAPAAEAGPDLKAIVVAEVCDNCGGPMTVRKGRRGFFLGCAKYPKCKGTKEPSEASLEKIMAATGG